MVLRMMGAVAANESASKSRRVRRKMVDNAIAGRPHGGSRRPFGFEDDRVTIRPDEAEVIRTIASRFLAGESSRSLATCLDQEGIRTVFEKPWRTTTMVDMLRSARIAGLREHNGQIVGKAVWEPIISVEDRGRLLALMEQRRSTKERTVRSYLLSGMLRCGKCGGTLFTAARKTSRRACQVVCVSGRGHGCLDVLVDAVGVDEGELFEGLFPVGGDLAFDESAGCFALASG